MNPSIQILALLLLGDTATTQQAMDMFDSNIIYKSSW
jgi:hypothetical protein